MYRVALESILGVHVEGGTMLCIRARLPSSWPEIGIRYRPGDGATHYDIVVRRRGGAAAGNGRGADGARGTDRERIVEAAEGSIVRIPLASDGGRHRLAVHIT
jgi:cyclic beta-1,2-glucan synthetase